MNYPVSIGISPCPNDCFIFYGLIHHKIKNNFFSPEVVMKDVEELNEMALQGRVSVCKMSYPVLLKASHLYDISSSGGAMGFGCGPLLISLKKKPIHEYESMVLPGEHTSAHFLFRFLHPEFKGKKIFLRYDRIENFLLNHPEAAGVIIHENRFTYHQKGLELAEDLGKSWEQTTGLPIPLGGIGIHKNLPDEIRTKIPSLILESLNYAYEHPEEVLDFMKVHAQELSKEVILAHVKTYVNEFSENIGERGLQSVYYMAETLGVNKKDIRIIP